MVGEGSDVAAGPAAFSLRVLLQVRQAYIPAASHMAMGQVAVAMQRFRRERHVTCGRTGQPLRGRKTRHAHDGGLSETGAGN